MKKLLKQQQDHQNQAETIFQQANTLNGNCTFLFASQTNLFLRGTTKGRALNEEYKNATNSMNHLFSYELNSFIL